jgi:hypothetical protein
VQEEVPGFEEVVSLSHVRSVKRRTLKNKASIGFVLFVAEHFKLKSLIMAQIERWRQA